jgi:hypothetical protein
MHYWSEAWRGKPLVTVSLQVGNHGGIKVHFALPQGWLSKSIQRGAVQLRGILSSDFHILLGDGHVLMA